MVLGRGGARGERQVADVLRTNTFQDDEETYPLVSALQQCAVLMQAVSMNTRIKLMPLGSFHLQKRVVLF